MKHFSVLVPIHKSKVLSSNARSFNYHMVTNKKNYTKQATVAAIRAAHFDSAMEYPCKVMVEVANLTNGRLDSVNTYPCVKIIVDTIVAEGLLPDDDSKVIEEISFRRMKREPDWKKDYYYFKLSAVKIE